MIKHGPVDVVVMAAGEPRFDGGVLAELERQAASRHDPRAGRHDPAQR